MIIDRQNRFSNAQGVTASAASEDSIDLEAVRNLGVGRTLYFVVVNNTAMADAGSDSTVTVTAETDDTSAFSSAVTRQTLGTFAAASPAGTALIVPMAQFGTAERHLRLFYTVAGGNLNAGCNFTAFITDAPQQFVPYADAITIS
jgi:hypothetical protein